MLQLALMLRCFFMGELAELLVLGSRLFSNLMWGWRCKEPSSSPGQPPQGPAERSHSLQAVGSQSSLLQSAAACVSPSAGLPGWILRWEEAGSTLDR